MLGLWSSRAPARAARGPGDAHPGRSSPCGPPRRAVRPAVAASAGPAPGAAGGGRPGATAGGRRPAARGPAAPGAVDTATTTTAAGGWLRALIPVLPRPAAAPTVPTVSAAEARERLAAAHVPLVVVFSATWCGPCKVMMARLENLARQLGPSGVSVVKVDTEESEGGSALATELGIYKLPTMIFAGPKEGSPAVQLQGLVPEAVLLDLVTNKAQFMGKDLEGKLLW